MIAFLQLKVSYSYSFVTSIWSYLMFLTNVIALVALVNSSLAFVEPFDDRQIYEIYTEKLSKSNSQSYL